MKSDRYAADVRADEQLARQLGITGVPFFLIESKWAVSGAQPAEMLGAGAASGVGGDSPC